MRDLETTFTMRVSADLLKAFREACDRSDLSAAQVLRAAMRQFVQDNAQGDLLAKKGKR
jgi:predicted transcriptional regulator